MTKTTITALAQDLCHDKADDTQLSTYYDDVLEELCKLPNCPFVAATNDVSVAAQSDYAFPTNSVRIIAIHYVEAPLSYSSIAGLEAYDYEWRDLTGDPDFYTYEDVSTRTYTLVPQPDTTDDTIKVFHTNNRETDIEDWAALSIALAMLSKEFMRPSDHQDPAFAEACKTGSQLLQQAAGY